jgi:glycosyltransferase involved in cell wall biosynthesis
LTDVVLVRASIGIYDPRVYKIVSSLSKRYSVVVLGWNREIAKTPVKDYVVDLEQMNFKTPYGKPDTIHFFYMIFYFAIFWTWVLIKLVKHKPKVVHACDLDVVLPCFLYKVIFRKKLVFDVFDRYAMTFIPATSKMLYSTVNLIEELFSMNADVLITISEKSLKTFRRRPKNAAIIMNYAADIALDTETSEEHDDKKDNVLRLVYTGGIKKGRSLENIAVAIKNLKNVELVIAGMVVDKELFDQIMAIPNVKYRGFLYPKDCLILEANADVMIALYDLKITWNSITTANKVFEAMMCSIPIITNVSPELVDKLDFGIMVDYDNIMEIRKAIILLRDNAELRLRLGSNGRKAFLEKYNWTKMEKQLYEIYENLV